MKLPQYSRYDWLIQAVLMPVYVGLLNWILIGIPYWQNGRTFVAATLLAACIMYVNWLVNNKLSLFFDELYPNRKQPIRRLLLVYLITTSVNSLNNALLFGLFYWTALSGFEGSLFRLGGAIGFTWLFSAAVILTYEGIHTHDHLHRSEAQLDALSKAQLQAQLDALKQQVNPHFLFNSLNSLISLIDESPKQAGIFAEELSSVYRYLLRVNQQPLTNLGSELAFVQSYYHLLKTRYGNLLTLETNILPGHECLLLPPLTLQLLIENAVKHNVVLPEQPLTIVLLTNEQNRLVVSNNLQRKPNRTLSNGVGLSNIFAQYQMLGQPAPVIEDDGLSFRVTLPLVAM